MYAHSQESKFISCGMYAFTDELRTAWQTLFDKFLDNYGSHQKLDKSIQFGAEFSLLRDPLLFLGHTCGYPLMRFLRDDLIPLCVPLFDVPGRQGKYYSSHIIVPRHSDIQNLGGCRGQIAAINGRDSNSGMNVLRHAVAPLAQGQSFFSSVRETGSHYQSLVDVGNQLAQVAAIDCVSFELIQDQWPELANKVRSIGFTEQTCGLPLVIPRDSGDDFDNIVVIEALNYALLELDEVYKSRLHLTGFEAVGISEYESILAMENFAHERDYTELS